MSASKEGSAKKDPKRIETLAQKLITDYIDYEKEGHPENVIKFSINKNIAPIDSEPLRAHLQGLIARDADQITQYQTSIRASMNEPWIFNQRTEEVGPHVIGATEEDELKMLNKVTDYAKIQDLLKKHRVACMILEKNSIRHNPKNIVRDKILALANESLPQLNREDSDTLK